MSQVKNLSSEQVIARGYRRVNYIRLGLAAFFGLAVAATGLGQFHRSVIQAEAVGTLVYLVVGLIGLYRMRGNRIPKTFSRVALFIDTTVLGGIMIYVCSDTSVEAYRMVKNVGFYAVIFLIIGYSAFLGQALLSLSVSIYAAILYTAGLYIASISGVHFGAANDYDNSIVGTTTIAVSVIIMPLSGLIIAGVLGIQKSLLSIADESASSNARLVESLNNQSAQVAKHASELDHQTLDFKEFIEITTGRIETQAAALEQANAVTEELTASSNQTTEIVQSQSKGIEKMARDSDELNSLVDEIRSSNQELVQSAEEALRSMEVVLKSVEGTSEVLEKLEEAFRSVSQITEIMTEIADKTNLLSLNASIEAARAGDAGRGFAVVANEVSKLADFTGQNVRQIADIVKESMTTVEEVRKQSAEASQQARGQKERTEVTNRQVEKTSNLLQRQASILSALVEELEVQMGRAGDVMSSSREQIDGQKELAKTMESLDKEISEISEAAKKLNDGITRISEQAAELTRTSQGHTPDVQSSL